MENNMVGAYKLADMSACNLPQNAASAFGVVNSMIGAKYIPVLYVGEQIVHGINYMYICRQTLSAEGAPEHLVSVVVNQSNNGYTIVRMERIV